MPPLGALPASCDFLRCKSVENMMKIDGKFLVSPRNAKQVLDHY